MSNRARRASADKSANSSKLDESTKSTGHNAGLLEMEYFWSIELNETKRTYVWMNNEEMEEGDEDFIEHTVFLKSAVLGANAVPGEVNIVMLESAGSEGTVEKGAIVNLCRGQNSMATMDMTVPGKVGPTTFRLVEGSGPVFISGNHLMEYPKEDDMLDNSQTESEEEETEEDEDEVDEDEGEEDEAEVQKKDSKKTIKRKAGPISVKPKQKAKMEVDDEGDEDDEDEEEEEEEEDTEDQTSEEELMVKKGKKGKDSGKKVTPKDKSDKKPAKKSKK